MSPEEVIEIEAIRAPKRIDGRHLRSVQALGDPEGGTNVLKRTYLFWNDKLHMIVELVPMFIEEPQTVIDALLERYGEPGQGDAQRIAAALSQSGMPYNYERTLEHYSVDGIMLRDWETSDAYIWFERTSEYAMVYYCPLRLTRR